MNHKENQKEKKIKIKSEYKNNNTKNIKGKEGVLPEKKKAKTASEDRGKKIKYKDREEAGAREAAARGEIATKEN